MKIMETKTKYGIRKAEERNQLREIDLMVVPHQGKDLSVALFGPNTYKKNRETMSKQYWHSNSQPNISFKPATTSESISAVAYDFGNEAKPKIFDPKWLQAGYIVRTQDGVFTNTQITDEKELKQLLNGAKKVNGIYLLNNKIGFAPYKTFERGVQDCDTFVRGGLARVLEHSEKDVAENLRTIASSKFYPKGIHVFGLNEVKEPILKVAGLYSYLGYSRLDVGGLWDDSDNGCAFGVCNSERSE